MFAPLMTSTASSSSELPTSIVRLADQLSAIHGEVVVALESSGYHLYMASPAALEQDGIIELDKRHLAVNADKYLGLGKWASSIGTYDSDNTAMCMKTEKAYRVSDLKNMKPVSERGYQAKTGFSVKVKKRYLVADANGNMVPEPPGTVIPLSQLPSDHPAIEYLTSRSGGPYSLKRLEQQFSCGFCVKETPERFKEIDGVPKKFYPPLPAGWKDTPQGRLIFYCMMRGAAVAWQARILEKVVGNRIKMFWHPYEEQWVPVQIKIDRKWQLMPEYDNAPPYTWQNPRWDPSKYRTASDAARNEILGGFDAAIQWNCEAGREKNPIGVLCEGPLDAGRFGPPAMFLAGKFISTKQAETVIKNFKEIVWVGDQDEAGYKATERVRAELGPHLRLFVAELTGVKDAGELTEDQAHDIIKAYLAA